MIISALDTGAPASLVSGDEVYGADSTLRSALEERGVGYVMAVGCNHRIPGPTGPVCADEVTAALPARSWAAVVRGRRHEGTPVVFMGDGDDHQRQARSQLVNGPPQRHHR
jgi:hypothetical protein